VTTVAEAVVEEAKTGVIEPWYLEGAAPSHPDGRPGGIRIHKGAGLAVCIVE